MASIKIVLKFPRHLVDQPIVCRLVKRYDLDFNILKALITPREEGLLALEIQGSDEACRHGMDYLREAGVHVQLLSQDIVRDDDRCTQCGACVGVCPSGALSLSERTRAVEFDSDKCIACELCIRACPPRAMELRY